jgi:hypothetical protein
MNSAVKDIRDSYDIVCEYYSDDGQRKACVIKNDGQQGFEVTCWKLNDNNTMICDRVIKLPTHSLYYAQDTAENWVIYVIK